MGVGSRQRPFFWSIGMGHARWAIAAVFFASAVCAPPIFPQTSTSVASPLVSLQASPQLAATALPSFVLTIADRDHKTIAEIPLDDGRFDHVFMHSIHQTPVVERFKVVAGPGGETVLHLYELDYESCGVGMPSEVEGGFSLVDGKFILDMSRDFAVIPLMVSTVEGHGVAARGRFYPFTDWVPQETLLFLSAKAAF
jgi:hypothetical protein